MDQIYSIIGTPLGYIMWALYHLVKNYGVALFLFTLIIRAALIPVTIKQQKSTAKMAMIQPRMKEIQQKYANNQSKMNEELSKLYAEMGYSPTSGCLPMVIQLVILFGLIDVIYRPLKHILHLPAAVIATVETMAQNLGLVVSTKGLNAAQILVGQAVASDSAPFVAQIGQEYVDKILSLDLTFFGINLGLRPEWGMFTEIFKSGFNLLLLIPILSFLSAIAMSIVSTRTAASNSAMAGGAAGSMKAMMFVMPFFSLYIAFQVPAGVGLYWFFSNLISMVQSLLMNKFFNPKEMAEAAQKEQEEREERERQERIEAKRLAKQRALEQGGDDPELMEKALSQKELNRRKLAEARRRDAEKYGEVYVDVTDEDLR